MFDFLFYRLAQDFGNYLTVLAALTFPNAVLTGICVVEGIRETDIEKKKDYRAWMWLFLSMCIFTAGTAVLWKFNGGDER